MTSSGITHIVWVTGGLVCTDKLAAALQTVDTKKVHITKVETVQEAVVEVFRGEGTISLILCDQILNRSIPPRELYAAAESKSIPFLMTGDEEDGDPVLMAAKDINMPCNGPLRKILAKFKIKKTDSIPSGERACYA